MIQNTQGAVIAAITTGTRVLLIKQPDRSDPKWKFPGGEIERGETVIQALAREIGDETGYPLKIHRGHDNRWVLSDDTIAHESVRTRPNREGDGGHEQFFFVIKVKNPLDLLNAGGGKMRREDDGETIVVDVFEIDAVKEMPDFLTSQLDLLKQTLEHCA